MNKRFIPSEHEADTYSFWEEKGYISPRDGDSFTILMPPPNANDPLHAGHGMYVIDDILIRWKRLRGYASLWIPGTDHAGFETQYVYEKHLKKNNKSRLDFDRKTLYKDIFTYVKNNSGQIASQLKRLGFLADWERSVFTLDPHVIARVYETFKKMLKEGLIYRDDYIVNYCVYCGTSLAELEVKYVEKIDPLYHIAYGPLKVATVRPETKFADTALAVNPTDVRYMKWIGKNIDIQCLKGKIGLKVIADEYVDKDFGTGVLKVTPAHDPNDFILGKKHNLDLKVVIDLEGRMTKISGPYEGMKVQQARKKISEDLKAKGLLHKIDEGYTHSVSTCYKCGRDVEPMIVPNWFVRVDKLKQPVIQAVKEERVRFFPRKYKRQMLDWLSEMHDWPISRQIAWGIAIPIWYRVDNTKKNLFAVWIDKDGERKMGVVQEHLQLGTSIKEICGGLQKLVAKAGVDDEPDYVVSDVSPGEDYLPETDTFDTWYSSGQWPLVTIREDEQKSRYPTDFIGTLSDILKFWISRMIMLSLYIRDEVPFKDVYLWSMVADCKGQKMSKSKGNVINPIEMIDVYGADAFRASLLFGIAEGGKVILAPEKVKGMRNFSNKVWNIGRFLKISREEGQKESITKEEEKEVLKKLNIEYEHLEKRYFVHMDTYRFSFALNEIYDFIWHRFADCYIEELKDRVQSGNIHVLEALEEKYSRLLLLLHPFMPFVTEALWREWKGMDSSILESDIFRGGEEQ